MSWQIPLEFAELTEHRDGALGAAWIRSLPDLVKDLLHRWDCSPDGAMRHGQVGLVVPVAAPEGPAVLKISPPVDVNRGEAVVLRRLAGRAAVRLYRDDPERCALLLERADGPFPITNLHADEAVEVMGQLALELAVPFPGAPMSLAATAGGWLDETDRRSHGLPDLVTPRALQRARGAIAVAAADTTSTVLHGDLHEGNVLAAERRPWLVIDPKGWSGTAAHDGWTVALTRYQALMLDPDPRAVVRRRLRRFAACARLDENLVIEIAHARAVSSLLYEATTSNDLFGLELLRLLVNDL